MDNILWTNYENETLIHFHKLSKVYKKRYQRAVDLHNSLYNIFKVLSVVSSTISATISWGIDINNFGSEDKIILLSITTVTAISAAIHNLYKFQERSTDYLKTAKTYAKIQNRVETIGNIHPEYRIPPLPFFKQFQIIEKNYRIV